jgi:hypothetical protein
MIKNGTKVTDMTNQEINAAIAEACGWNVTTSSFGVPPTQTAFSKLHGYDELPNYCEDLNAMHEAYLTMTEDNQWEFVKTLVDYTPGSFPLLSRSESLVLANATARQRAEAFLKTVGKWEE